jgi:hypothetical protein
MDRRNMNLRTDGFVRHYSVTRSVIRADVERRVSKNRVNAVMHSNCIRRVCWATLDYLEPAAERPHAHGAAAKRGYILTFSEEEHALEAKDVLMSELAANDK